MASADFSQRRLLRAVGRTCVAVLLTFIAAELLIRLTSPQVSMYPRWEFSLRYGLEPSQDASIIHPAPGRWRFTYTTNEHRHRGDPVPVSDEYARKNIVVLGDSYTFGIGVDDGEEYAAVMQARLRPEFDVINLGSAGWGLTQQIRRYYEFGQAYRPQLVIVQFSSNDPRDNFRNRVTTIENGRLTFHNGGGTINWLRNYLSGSVIQKSQVYNLVRDFGYRFFDRRIVSQQIATYRQSGSTDIPPEQEFYLDLFDFFVQDLSRRGVGVIMISVADQLDGFPHIRQKVDELHSSGLLRYTPTTEWFDDETALPSPEGHLWGREAHAIVGTELSKVVEQLHSP